MRKQLLIGAIVLSMGGMAFAADPPAAPLRGRLAQLGGDLKAKLLEKFDKNGDGKLDADELKAAREELMKSTQNGNGPLGQITGDLKKKLLDKYDKNGDGKLDADELKAATAELQTLRGRLGK